MKQKDENLKLKSENRKERKNNSDIFLHMSKKCCTFAAYFRNNRNGWMAGTDK